MSEKRPLSEPRSSPPNAWASFESGKKDAARRQRRRRDHATAGDWHLSLKENKNGTVSLSKNPLMDLRTPHAWAEITRLCPLPAGKVPSCNIEMLGEEFYVQFTCNHQLVVWGPNSSPPPNPQHTARERHRVWYERFRIPLDQLSECFELEPPSKCCIPFERA